MQLLHLTHWGLGTHICTAPVKWVIISSSNSLAPVLCPAISWTITALQLIGSFWKNINEIWWKTKHFFLGCSLIFWKNVCHCFQASIYQLHWHLSAGILLWPSCHKFVKLKLELIPRYFYTTCKTWIVRRDVSVLFFLSIIKFHSLWNSTQNMLTYTLIDDRFIQCWKFKSY